MKKLRLSGGVAVVLLGSLQLGCGGGPGRINVPGFSPSRDASKAMDLYDADGDGFIAGGELDKAPGLKAAMSTLDADGDGKVSEGEIAARIQSWIDSKIGLTGFRCEIRLDGRPVKDATVTFEPEPFLEGTIQQAVGVTDRRGVAKIKIPKDRRPSPDSPPGLQTGFYRVRLSAKQNGSELFPASANTETVLGQQIARDDPAKLITAPTIIDVASE